MKASQEDQSHSSAEMGKMMTRRSRKVTQYRPDISSEILCNTTKPTSFLLWPSPGAATVNFDDDATVNNLLELRGIPLSADAEENKDKKLPLVVWLHGFGGYSEFQRRGGAKTLDELLGDGEIEPMAFVTFRAPGGRRSRSVYINGEQSGDVEDAIVKDLVAYMEKNYPVSKSPAHHAIMGVSIGGFGALKIAMKHPEVFGVVAAH